MKFTQLQIQVTVEARSKSCQLQNCINQVMALNPCMRETVGITIRNRGLRAHVGGRHVAILADNGERLAMFTGNSPDFN